MAPLATSLTTVLLLDAETGERLATIRANTSQTVNSLDLSTDNRSLAVASTDQQILVWDLPLLRRELARLGLDWPGGQTWR
jgi:WD40 repeat protein